jgi:hypothetical protein
LTLTQVTVTGNLITVTAGTPAVPNRGFGAGIFSGGQGSLSLSKARATNNSVTVDNNAAGGGAGIATRGPLTIDASTIANNSVTPCANANLCGEQAGGVAVRFGPAAIMNTTISGNVGTNAEGGLDDGFGPIKIVNSTIAGNSAPGPGRTRRRLSDFRWTSDRRHHHQQDHQRQHGDLWGRPCQLRPTDQTPEHNRGQQQHRCRRHQFGRELQQAGGVIGLQPGQRVHLRLNGSR